MIFVVRNLSEEGKNEHLKIEKMRGTPLSKLLITLSKEKIIDNSGEDTTY